MSSDRKKADPSHGSAELSGSNEILHSILSDMGDAVIVADKDENFVVFNPAASACSAPGRPRQNPRNGPSDTVSTCRIRLRPSLLMSYLSPARFVARRSTILRCSFGIGRAGGRTALFHSSFEPGWETCASWRGAESPQSLCESGGRRSHWTTQWLLRDGHVHAKTGCSDRCDDRSALGGLS
jgi:hypothetical protein